MLEHKRLLKVFLCYAHTDRQPVETLYARLVQVGVDVWLDKKKLLPGQDWELEIRKAVREADVVVVCLSRHFKQRGFRQKEVRWALDTAMQQPEREIFIIPLRLEECDTLESLRKWHWVDLFKENGYERLIQALSARASSMGMALQVNTSKLPEETPSYWAIEKTKKKYFEILDHGPLKGRLRNKLIVEFMLTLLSLIVILVIILSIASIARSSRTKPVYVTSNVSGKREIYIVDEQRELKRVTTTPGQYESWSPTPDSNGNLYFVSDRGGNTEIYMLNSRGETLRITFTSDGKKSWSPAPDGQGNLYFVSDRSGEIDIYLLMVNGEVKEITTTPELANSWSPAPDGSGNLYFVSDRTGEIDIYVLTSTHEMKRVMTTQGSVNNWSPVPDQQGNLYFVSDRAGKTDIYRWTPNSGIIRVTYTSGSANSWSPVPDGKGNLYFTSDRTGKIETFVLTRGNVYPVGSKAGQSWTGTLSAKNIGSDSK